MTSPAMLRRCFVAALGILPFALGAQAIVRADGPPAWGTAVRLEPVATIGVVDGPPEYAFGRISSVVGEKNGGFFLYDGKQKQIRHYNAAGKATGVIGRTGEGPGEYQDVNGMALVGDSLLSIWDTRGDRVTLYGVDGKVRSSFRPQMGSYYYASDTYMMDAAGIVYVMISDRGVTPPGTAYQRYRSTGQLIDTVRAPREVSEPGFVLLYDDGARFSFGEKLLGKPSPLGGMLSASTMSLGFTITRNGTARTVQRKFTPLPLGGDERKEWVAYAQDIFERSSKNRPTDPHIITPEPHLTKIPTLKPALRDLFADREGRVWLDVYTAAEKREVPPSKTGRPVITWRERATYDVFAETGSYLGRVVLPPRHQVLDVAGDRVLTLTKGPDDEEKIVIFRIVRGK